MLWPQWRMQCHQSVHLCILPSTRSRFPYEQVSRNITCIKGLEQFSLKSLMYRTPAECSTVNDTMPGMEYHAVMRAHSPGTYTTFYCKAKPSIHVSYKLDPSLTVWLSLVSWAPI
jgi:hypothetical protein